MSTRQVSRAPYLGIPPVGVFLSLIVLSLTFLGLVALFSASQAMHDDPTVLLRKQLIWLVIASCAGGITMFINLEVLRQYSYWLGGIAVLLLLLVLVPGLGVRVNGAQRWMDFGPMRLQVSEIGKLGLLFVMAHYLTSHRRHLDDFIRGYIVPVAMVGTICILIMLEPDFGTAFLCGMVGGLLMFLANVRLKFLIPSALAALCLFSIAVYLDPVRLQRVTSFLDVEGNRADSSYQLWQGILAFGSGGIPGVGLGAGRQQMSFLPEAHTDFIFAVIGEELGLVFTAGVVVLFMTLFFIGVLQLKQAPNLYQYLLVMGSLLYVTLQALINIGVVTGCLPTKGMSLPFISYGGSNLVLMFTLMGIILNGFRSWQISGLRLNRDL
jgi:cell division protein FtsW